MLVWPAYSQPYINMPSDEVSMKSMGKTKIPKKARIGEEMEKCQIRCHIQYDRVAETER